MEAEKASCKLFPATQGMRAWLANQRCLTGGSSIGGKKPGANVHHGSSGDICTRLGYWRIPTRLLMCHDVCYGFQSYGLLLFPRPS